MKHTIATSSSFLDKVRPHSHHLSKFRCHCDSGWLASAGGSKVLNCLELPYNPAVSTGRHQDNVVHHRMLVVNRLSSIQDLIVVLGCVMQLNDVALRGIEHGFNFMSLIRIVRRQTVPALAADLVREPGVRLSDKKTIKWRPRILLQCFGEIGPGKLVIPEQRA